MLVLTFKSLYGFSTCCMRLVQNLWSFGRFFLPISIVYPKAKGNLLDLQNYGRCEAIYLESLTWLFQDNLHHLHLGHVLHLLQVEFTENAEQMGLSFPALIQDIGLEFICKLMTTLWWRPSQEECPRLKSRLGPLCVQLARSHNPMSWRDRLFGYLKLLVGVSGCLFVCVSDRLPTGLWCTQPLALWQLGLSPAPPVTWNWTSGRKWIH